ncbi:MAG TPA: hypothetical protein VED87_07875, partial [Methylocystis sp.]|nr:hypothetical protein [Methylocystis sp.]
MTKPHSRSFKNSIRDDYRSPRDSVRRYDREEDFENDSEDEEGVEDAEEAPESPLDSVTRRFKRSNPRYAAPPPRARRRRDEEEEEDAPPSRREPAVDPDELAETAAALVTRRVAASERHTAKALDNIARMIENNNRRHDESSRLEEALAAVQRRADASERKTARALENIAELIDSGGKTAQHESFEHLTDRLGRIEQRLAQPPADESRPIRGVLARLESRIDRLSKDDRTDSFARRLSGLDERLSQIAARLDEDAQARAAVPPPPPAAPEREALMAPSARARRPLADAIADITRRQQALDEELGPLVHSDEAVYDAPRRRPRLEDLRVSMEALSRRLDARAHEEREIRDPQIEALHGHLDSLRRQIEEVARTGHPDLAMRIEELRDAIEAQTRQTENLRAEVMQRPGEQLAMLDQLETLRRETEDLAQAERSTLVRRIEELRASHEDLAQRIDDLRGDPGRPDQQFLFVRQIEALERKIAETANIEPPRLVERFAQLDDAAARLAHQLVELRSETGHNARQQGQLIKQMDGLRKEVGDLSRLVGDIAPRASVAAIETALRDLSQRIDMQRHRGVRESELAPAGHIANELRVALKDLDPAPMLSHLNVDVAKIMRRLDEMQSGGGDASTLQELSRQTAEIKDSLRLLASRPFPAEKLETRLTDLTQRVDALSLRAATPKAAADMGDLVKSIRSIVASETGASLNAFNQKLERIADKLDAAVAGNGKKRFEELGARIDEMHKSLAQRIDQGAAQRPSTTAALESLVATLAKRIDGALDARTENSAFQELGRKIERLETHIPGATESMARIERMLERPGAEGQFAGLSQKLEEIGKTLTTRFEQGLPRTGAEARHFEDLAQTLGDRIDAALAHGAGRRELQQVEQQIGMLSKKLDRLAEIPPAAQLRAESGKDELADLVERLAKKIDGALAPGADAAAIAGLEDQIRLLSERLDRNGNSGAALGAIEAKIAELFARLEEARTGAAEAAESALRQATLDVLREANAAAKLNPAMMQEIDDLRRVQDESGARTHETLTVVHETLERVVDRLAAFEDELTELRAPPPEPTRAIAPPRDAAPPAAASAPTIKLHAEPPLSEPALQRRGVEVEDLDLDELSDQAPTVSQRGAIGAAAPTDFIAAARRAAQRAAAEAEAAQSQQDKRRAAARARAADSAVQEDTEEAQSTLAAVGGKLSANKRPILIGLAMLVMLGGAYQMAHLALPPSTGSAPPARTATAPAPAESQKSPARAEDAAPPKPASSILPPQLLPPPAEPAP